MHTIIPPILILVHFSIDHYISIQTGIYTVHVHAEHHFANPHHIFHLFKCIWAILFLILNYFPNSLHIHFHLHSDIFLFHVFSYCGVVLRIVILLQKRMILFLRISRGAIIHSRSWSPRTIRFLFHFFFYWYLHSPCMIQF